MDAELSDPTISVYIRSQRLLDRFKLFAVDVVHLCAKLPQYGEAQIIAKQLCRSGMSPGAQYGEARRARSTAEYISKIEGALQELEETVYWIDLLALLNLVQQDDISSLLAEAKELISILVASARKAKRSSRSS